MVSESEIGQMDPNRHQSNALSFGGPAAFPNLMLSAIRSGNDQTLNSPARHSLSGKPPRRTLITALPGSELVSACVWLYGLPHSLHQPRQIVADSLPDGVQLHSIVSMTKPVANAPNIRPRLTGTPPLGFIPKPDRRLADDPQFPFHGSNGFRVLAERLEIHARLQIVGSSSTRLGCLGKRSQDS